MPFAPRDPRHWTFAIRGRGLERPGIGSLDPQRHFFVCLKYFRSGGGWSFFAGIR
jgi:hypothetical protein